MKIIGKILLILSFLIFIFGALSFKSDIESEQKELTKAVNAEYYEKEFDLYPEQVQDLYKNRYIFDGLVIGFGAVCLVVGGLLIRKQQ